MSNPPTRRIIGYVMTFVILVFVGYIAWDYAFVDRCLDRGGRWNYSAFSCEK
jgi:hypothetical protein